MRCPYCDTEFDTETLKAFDEDFRRCEEDDIKLERVDAARWEDGEREGIVQYTCTSCGGEIIAEETTGSMRCPYCDSPVIMSRSFAGKLRPDLVIPFKLDKKAAKKAFASHLLGKRLLPKVFKDENHIDEIKGLYVPFWLFTADTSSAARYKATRTRMWTSGDYDYTETSHFSVFRSGELSFTGIPADGSSRLPDDLMESVEPFDLSEAVDFQSAYLSGYLSDRYDVCAEDRAGRVTERMKGSAASALRSSVMGYDSVISESTSIKVTESRTKYVLYPVWIMNTTWRGEKYLFAMNGQTGKFVGNLPVDKGLYKKYLLGIASAVTAALYALSLILFFM